MDYRIVPVRQDNIVSARKLVDTVFVMQSMPEWLSLRLFTLRGSFPYRLISWVMGADLLDFWIADDGNGAAFGISGLYNMRKDRDEAVWLGWYAVHPTARGKGIGGALLRHAIKEARRTGAAYLRLYTSDSTLIDGSLDAQGVYEKYGLKVKNEKMVCCGFTVSHEGFKIIREKRIIREMPL